MNIQEKTFVKPRRGDGAENARDFLTKDEGTDNVQTPLSKPELEQLHGVLRRAAERAERNRDTRLAARLAQEIAVLDAEINEMPSSRRVFHHNDNRSL